MHTDVAHKHKLGHWNHAIIEADTATASYSPDAEAPIPCSEISFKPPPSLPPPRSNERLQLHPAMLENKTESIAQEHLGVKYSFSYYV